MIDSKDKIWFIVFIMLMILPTGVFGILSYNSTGNIGYFLISVIGVSYGGVCYFQMREGGLREEIS
jgi:hypothetical protein